MAHLSLQIRFSEERGQASACAVGVLRTKAQVTFPKSQKKREVVLLYMRKARLGGKYKLRALSRETQC